METNTDDLVDVPVADMPITKTRGVPSEKVDNARVNGKNVTAEGGLVFTAFNSSLAVNPAERPPSQPAFVEESGIVGDCSLHVRPIVVVERKMFRMKRGKTFRWIINVVSAGLVMIFVANMIWVWCHNGAKVEV